MKKKPSLIYLAGPYTHRHRKKRAERAAWLTYAAGILILEGGHVYSPITQSHAISHICDIKNTKWAFWKSHDLNVLSRCDKLVVLMLPGWKKSVGVTAEIRYAKKHKIPIEYMSISDVTVDDDVLVIEIEE